MKGKKFSAQFWMGVIVAGLVGYAVFDVYWEKRTNEKESESAKLFNFKESDVQIIDYKGEKESFLLRREGDSWLVEGSKSNSQEMGDAKEIASWIAGMLGERATKTIATDAQTDFSIYGLSIPQYELKLDITNQGSMTIQIGTRKTIVGESYLKISGREGVFVSGASWLNWGGKTAIGVTDRRWFKEAIADIQNIEFQKPALTFQLEKKDATWKVVDQNDLILDQNQVRSLIKVISQSPYKEKSCDLKTENGCMAKLLLGRPVLEIVLKLKENRTWKAALFERRAPAKKKGESVENQFFASLADRIVEIDRRDFDELFKADPTTLRDRKVPFQFDLKSVVKVSLATPIKQISFQKEGNNWKWINADSQFQFQSEDLDRLLKKFETFEVAQYRTNLQKKLNTYKLELFDKNGNRVFEFSVSDQGEIAFLDDEKVEVLFANSSITPEIFTIRRDDFEDLGMDQIIRSTAAEQKDEE